MGRDVTTQCACIKLHHIIPLAKNDDKEFFIQTIPCCSNVNPRNKTLRNTVKLDLIVLKMMDLVETRLAARGKIENSNF